MGNLIARLRSVPRLVPNRRGGGASMRSPGRSGRSGADHR